MVQPNQWQIIKNPLIESNLTIVRNKNTKRSDFCQAITNIAKLLVFSVTANWTTKPVTVETPFVKTQGLILEKPVVLIPILRAGMALLEGFKDLLPTAKIGHIGMYRDKQSFQAYEYYFNVPQLKENDEIVLLDPMVATANTVINAIKRLKKENPACQISLVSIITSQYAKQKIDQSLTNINIYTVNIDPDLNEKKYIIPGFGDAGDRFFGTE